MKVMQINIFGNLSTGRIAVDIYKTLKNSGHEGMVAFSRNTIEDGIPYFRFGNKWSVYSDVIMTRLTDRAGFYSKCATQKLISKIKEYDPDIIHIHNIHGYYLNIEILFNYLKESGKPVVWTLHDCWSFTGHCCHFSAAGCTKWETECNNCPQISSYPTSFRDNSKINFRKKKELFTSPDKMHIVTVSKWLESTVKKSFLNKYPIQTIYNGIDLSVFKPTVSNIKEKLNIQDRKIILGVASTWSRNKGLNDFVALSQLITKEYVIVLVGLNNKQIKKMPDNIIALPRTGSIKELVELYSCADVYFNSSIEETFGLPTIEAMACGTPVIVYDSTALPEVVNDGCGKVIDKNNVKEVWASINELPDKNIIRQTLLSNAGKYEKEKQYLNYIKLYEEIVQSKFVLGK